MARKIVNRKELRREGEAAEKAGVAAKTTEKKPPAKRKTRSKTAKEIRRKAFWGVYNQSLKRVARFEYSERKQADKKALELTASQKTPHFVQVDKEDIVE
ncbi:MAG TPA: hypothetical protein VJ783_16355 [Pirellulales bacterium]|nr:hypothetical protein [Pirellulales bacterium]